MISFMPEALIDNITPSMRRTLITVISLTISHLTLASKSILCQRLVGVRKQNYNSVVWSEELLQHLNCNLKIVLIIAFLIYIKNILYLIIK